MKRFLWIVPILATIAFLLPFKVLGARPNLSLATASPSDDRAIVAIPNDAVEVAPGVFNLGIAVVDGKKLEGFAFVDYREDHAKPGSQCGNGICEPGENSRRCPSDCGGGGQDSSSCYGFLSKDAKWKSIESYVVNPSNNKGLSENFVVSNVAGNINKWENAASLEILGNGSSTNDTLEADMNSPDNKNEVYFADIASSNAIGVTIVWGFFRGPPSTRELVEWDQVYDDVDFDWSSSGEPNKMDFEGISTHELGHSVGLDDLYEGTCSEQTMYGYAEYGETKKRTLESGDIAGVSELYK